MLKILTSLAFEGLQIIFDFLKAHPRYGIVDRNSPNLMHLVRLKTHENNKHFTVLGRSFYRFLLHAVFKSFMTAF